MRVTRVEKFKKYRHKKAGRMILYIIVLPCTCILVGYLLTSLVILPAMAK